MGRPRARAGWFAALIVGALGALVVGAWIRASLCPVESLTTRTPERTALMEQRAVEAQRDDRPYRLDQRWVPYHRISPLLRRAILVAEDDAFYAHGGLDWNEIRASARTNLERKSLVRGGSTITQQLARNLFLGDHRTPERKLEEVFVALNLERKLSKRRIFELYLNLIEWGEGIFGAEAAAEHYFQVPASQLSEREAILLAAVIINPRRFSVLHPSRRIEKRVAMIAGRLRRRGFLSEDQYLAALGKPAASRASFFEWFFGSRQETPPAAPQPAASESTSAPESTSVPRSTVSDSVAGPVPP